MIKIINLYDNRAYSKDLLIGWGFSALIDLGGERILFDVGWNGRILLENMRKMNLSLSKIDYLFLSHCHWDHIGSLAQILEEMGGVRVYLPKSFSRNFKREVSKLAEVIEVSRLTRISSDVYSTGELGVDVKEQSLLLKSGGEVIVVTGCAHPGLREIIYRALRIGPIRGVIGGLHSFREFKLLRRVGFISPTHCTRYIRRIEELYPKKFIRNGVGRVIELD